MLISERSCFLFFNNLKERYFTGIKKASKSYINLQVLLFYKFYKFLFIRFYVGGFLVTIIIICKIKEQVVYNSLNNNCIKNRLFL